MLCSISGTLAIEPVFNTKTRKIYDKKTLESFAIAHPEEMGELVPVANNPFINPKSTSIPALLVQFQNEWDALATELYQVKQQLYDTRTQLSTALYENDAAKRVVARLIKEKDDAVNRLLSLAPTTVPEPVAMDVDVTVLDSSVSVKIDSTFKILKEARMKRKAPDTYATLEDISSLKLGEPISTSHNSGIIKMDLLEAVLNDTPTRLLLAASKDGKITVRTFTDSSSEQIFTQKSHKKEVLCLLFSPLKNGSFYSSGVDKTLKMFSYQSTLKSPFKETWSVSFPSPILSFDIHPSGDFIISCTSTEWIFINSHDGSVISRCEGSFSFIKFHPDGVLFAVSSNSEVLIYDIKTNSIASRFSAVVKGFSFSQNGYYLAVSKDDKIEIWDLRKQGNVFKTIECQGNVSCVEWDSFGGYLGAFVDGSVVVYQNKSFEKLKEIECAGVNGFRFGKDAKSLICACDDGQFALLN